MPMKISMTPLSTGLSGSAKETELRLRNIFQWKKKRPPVILFLLTIVVVLACFGLAGFQSNEDKTEKQEPSQETENIPPEGILVNPEVPTDAESVPIKEVRDESIEDIPTAYFRKKLSAVAPNTPVVITDRKTFDWCGTTVTAVTATNVVVTDWGDGTFNVTPRQAEDPYPEPNPPSGEHTVMYRMSALFVDDGETVDLMQDMVYTVSKEPLENSSVSYDPGEFVNFTQFLSVVQYGEDGKMITCPVFCDHGGELTIRLIKYSPTYSLADTDCDGVEEFLLSLDRQSSLYSFENAYDLVNGVPQHGAATSPLYRDILLGQMEFYLDGKGMTLPQYSRYTDQTGAIHYRRPEKFAILDLDGDRHTEVVVTVNNNDHSLILREQHGTVYAYVRYIRQFNTLTLKTDGTFGWSGSAFYHGIGRLAFGQQEVVADDITYVNATVDPAVYVVDNLPADADAFDAAYAAQDVKPDVTWYDLTEENINTLLEQD